MSKQLHVSSGANIEGGVATDAIDLKSVPTLPIVKGDIRIVNNNGVLSTTTDGVTFSALGGSVTTDATLTGNGTGGSPLGVTNPAQSPSAVAITGGSITGVNTATRTVQGAESAADKAYSDDFDGWKKKVYAAMVAADPASTGLKAVDVGTNPPGGTTVSNDAALEGGGLTTTSAASVLLGASVFQNMPG